MAPATVFYSAQLALGSHLLIVGCLTGQVPGSPGGCYDVEVGSWRAVSPTAEPPESAMPLPDRSPDSVYYSLPSRIRFTTEPSTRMDRAFEVATPANVLPVPHTFTWWRQDADSVSVVFSTGFSGSVSVVRPSANSWTGQLRTFSDAFDVTYFEQSIDLVSADCGSPAPVPITLLRQLPRTVRFAGGGALLLGQPIPAGLETMDRSPRTNPAVLGDVAGLFAGADSVIARLNQDKEVSGIEVSYLVGRSWPEIVGQIEGVWGARDTRDLPFDGYAHWSSRTTRVSVSLGRRGRVRVRLIDPRFEF